MNGVAWIAKLEIAKDGVPSPAVDTEMLEKVMDDARAAMEKGR